MLQETELIETPSDDSEATCKLRQKREKWKT